MSLLPMTQCVTQPNLSIKSRFCSRFNGIKNTKMNQLVIISDACNVFANMFCKINPSDATSIVGPLPLVSHINFLSDRPKVRPNIVAGHAINMVNVSWPISKHQKCGHSVSKAYLAKYSKCSVAFSVQRNANNFSGVSCVVFFASAFDRIPWVKISAWLKHVRSSSQPNKLPGLRVVFNGFLNQIVNVRHEHLSPFLFDNVYTSLNAAEQGA